jgi:hypothetical protein
MTNSIWRPYGLHIFDLFVYLNFNKLGNPNNFRRYYIMGERLVFKCIKDDKMFATLYYHWSAYTICGFEEGAEIVKGLKYHNWSKEMSTTETIGMLVNILEHNVSVIDSKMHGGVSGGTGSDEWKALIEMGVTPHEGEHVDRTYGLIDVTEEGMNGALGWAEQIEEINFDEGYFTANNYYLFDIDDKESMEEFFEMYGNDIDINNIPELPDILYSGKIPFDDLGKAEEAIKILSAARDTARGIAGRDGNTIFTIMH